MTARFIEPVTLRGSHVTLEPLAPGHLAGIREAAADGDLWNLWYTSVPAPERTDAWLALAALPMKLNLIVAGVAGIVAGTVADFAKERWTAR